MGHQSEINPPLQFDNARRIRDLLNELQARSLRAFEDAEG